MEVTRNNSSKYHKITTGEVKRFYLILDKKIITFETPDWMPNNPKDSFKLTSVDQEYTVTLTPADEDDIFIDEYKATIARALGDKKGEPDAETSISGEYLKEFFDVIEKISEVFTKER
jgi:hypothetical protein